MSKVYYVINLTENKRYELYENKTCSIGRNSSNRAVISDHYLLVSRFHGEIKLIDRKISYIDFPENHNGTFLASFDDYSKNPDKYGIWLEIKRGVKANLHHNDVLRLGGKESRNDGSDARVCDFKIECVEADKVQTSTKNDEKSTEIASTQIKE